MRLTNDDLVIARRALRERANWASIRGFFGLAVRDAALLSALADSPDLDPGDVQHVQSVLMRVGGDENLALVKRMWNV